MAKKDKIFAWILMKLVVTIETIGMKGMCKDVLYISGRDAGSMAGRDPA